MGDTKNIVLFAAISIAVFFGYNALFISPQQEALQREAVQQQAAAQLEDGLAPKEAAPSSFGDDTPVQVSAPTQLEDAGSITITNPELSGSLSLRGARINDLLLTNHKVSLDDGAANVRLLASANQDKAYYVHFGWSTTRQNGITVPDQNSVWSADNEALAPGQPVTLAWDNGDGVRFMMKMDIDDQFMFTVTQTVINSTDEAIQLAPYAVIDRKGEPKTDGLYILHEGPLGVINGKLEEKSYKDLAEDGDFDQASTGGWMGITDKYWMTALIPDQKAELSRARLAKTATGYSAGYAQTWQTVGAGASVETTNRLYAGAKIVSAIDNYEIKYGIDKFDRAIDWGYFYFLTRPIFKGLHWLFQVTGNYGVAILAMTVILKLILFPLANKSYRSMSHMKDAQPKIKALQERYKDDKQRLQQEMMALYKKEKINPMAGCLPMIPQIFIFFALYKTLYVTIEMRHQPFFGWITDLSARDTLTPVNLFGLIPWDPPAMIAIGVLPILMGITMWLQQKLNPQTSMDPTQQKVMSFLPIIFTFIMAGFSSGLVLYWTWNNLLSIAQQSFIMKREHARREALGKA
ncbi:MULTISPECIES: membrane protein insertase YidC [Kordiimonas]|jgi:YidC/Oxa1 family membrane protein insertase|uniref:membrane protein insertase YidC n=1 Tax=Kordiimonas TaxID=288021 RepID=UPI00257A6E6E|nr:membrane protein insertase YidC [Kordiimonas sp. UBA4487]